MKRNTYLEMLAKQKDLLSQKGYDFATFQSKSILERYEILHSLQEEYLGSDKPINHIRPIISVCIPTYQQHDYIRGCIEGALMQQTSFPFEIVVGDDGSVDGTTEICMEYAEKYPDKIRFYNRTRELCRVFDEEGHIEKERAGNWWWTLQDGRGIYIAICEGDDYWIDPLKLQKQVDFLENNPDYSISHTSFNFYYELEKQIVKNRDIEINRGISREFSYENILYYGEKKYRIQTLTVVFRRKLQGDILESDDFIYKSDHFLMGDTPLWYDLLRQGKVHYLPEVTSVYRINRGSITRSIDLLKSLQFIFSMAEIRMYLIKRDSLSNDLYVNVAPHYHNTLFCCKCLVKDYPSLFPLDASYVHKSLLFLSKLGLLKHYLVWQTKIRSLGGRVRRLLIHTI